MPTQRAACSMRTPRLIAMGPRPVLRYGHAALVVGWVHVGAGRSDQRMWRDLQDEWQVPVRLVVSGGAVDEVTSALKVPHTRHDSLVLSGLALIAAEHAMERGA